MIILDVDVGRWPRSEQPLQSVRAARAPAPARQNVLPVYLTIWLLCFVCGGAGLPVVV